MIRKDHQGLKQYISQVNHYQLVNNVNYCHLNHFIFLLTYQSVSLLYQQSVVHQVAIHFQIHSRFYIIYINCMMLISGQRPKVASYSDYLVQQQIQTNYYCQLQQCSSKMMRQIQKQSQIDQIQPIQLLQLIQFVSDPDQIDTERKQQIKKALRLIIPSQKHHQKFQLTNKESLRQNSSSQSFPSIIKDIENNIKNQRVGLLQNKQNKQKHIHQNIITIKYIITIINYFLFKNHKIIIIDNSYQINQYLKINGSLANIQLRDMILLIQNQSEEITMRNWAQMQQMGRNIEKMIVYQEQNVKRFTNFFTVNMLTLYQLIERRSSLHSYPLRHMQEFLQQILRKHQKYITFYVNFQELLHLKFIIFSEQISILLIIIKQMTQCDYLQSIEFQSNITIENYHKYEYHQLQQYFNQNRNHRYFIQGVNAKNAHLNYSQSMHYQFQRREKFDLSEINEDLRKNDILALQKYWNDGLSSYIQYLISHWQMHRCSNAKQLLDFAHINDYNIQRFKVCKNVDLINNTVEFISFYELIYSNITIITRKILNLFKKLSLQDNIFEERNKMKIPINFDYSACKRKFQKIYEQRYCIAQDKITNQIIDIYIAEEIQKIKGGPSNLKNLKIRMDNGEFMNIYSFVMKFEGFYRCFGEWNDLLSRIKRQIEYQYKKQQSKLQFYRDLHNEKMVQLSCLGCSTFFYFKMNVYDESVNKVPLKSFPSIKLLKAHETQVKDYICSMINSGGGIILFDCRLQFKNVIIQGVKMTQKQKQQYENRIYSYLNHFYPKMLPKFNIMVEFVPIINNQQNYRGQLVAYAGEDNLVKTNRVFKSRQFIQSWFVTRIKIIPTDAQRVYFWYTEQQTNGSNRQIVNKYCSRMEKGQSKQLSMSQMRKLIKKKAKFYKQQLNLRRQELKYNSQRFSYFDHICKDAQKVKQQYSIPNKKVPNHQQFINYEQKYKNVSLLYVQNKIDIGLIKDQLQKNKIQFNIQPYANSQHFKSAQKYFFIFYNKKFSQIKSLLTNFNIFLTNITSFIKFSKISLEQFQKYTNSFNEEFKQEYMRFYEFILPNGQKEYYFQTQTKVSTVFMYFLLRQTSANYFNLIEQPFLICPFLLDKLSKQERQSRFILLYEKRQNLCQFQQQISQDNDQLSPNDPYSYQFIENNYFYSFQKAIFDK